MPAGRVGVRQKAELLLITDEKDSSRKAIEAVPEATRKHFKQVVKLIEKFNSNGNRSYVIKNIGDSLMIKVELAMANQSVPLLLSGLLKALRVLRPHGRDEVPIRVLLMKLWRKEFIDGKVIHLGKEADSECLPKPRVRGSHWLAGDLFGSQIALAFRAAQVPSGTGVVIDENVAKLLKTYRDSAFRHSINNRDSLYFGDPLAFSPFKGLERLYPFAEPDQGRRPFWRGHLFLRTVTGSRKEFEKNALATEQQKIRAITRLVWSGKPGAKDIKYWVSRLSKIDGSAGYVRSIGKVFHEGHANSVLDCAPVRKLKVAVRACMQKEMYPEYTRLLVIFAGHSDSTYQEIRNRIGDMQEQVVKKPVALTTFVFSDDFQRQRLLEPNPGSQSAYGVIMARLQPTHRRLLPDTILSSMDSDPTLKNMGCEIKHYGKLMGGEFDVYLLLSLENRAPHRWNKATAAQFFQHVWGEHLRNNHVKEAAGFFCRQVYPKRGRG